MNAIHDFLQRHGYALAALFIIFAAVFGPFPAAARPFDFDDVHAIAFGARPDPLAAFFGRSQATMPFYRPVPYLSFWAQYQVVGVNSYTYYLLNVIIWAGCAYLLYGLVYALARSRAAGLLAALLLAFDLRAVPVMTWVSGRQASLVILFGLAAWLLVLMPWRDRFKRLTWPAIFLLLLASPMSYEFGLAFSAALIVYVFATRDPTRRGLALTALAAAGTYLALRQFLGPGFGSAGYCEDMGLFTATQRVCYDTLGTGEKLLQYAYNAGANLVGSILPNLFDQYGTLGAGVLEPGPLLTSLLIAALAFIGCWQAPRRALPLLVLTVGGALLGFLIYRQRTHLVGLAGLYGAAGIGLTYTLAWLRQRQVLAPYALAALLVILLAGWALGMQHTLLHSSDSKHATYAPCDLVNAQYNVSPELLADILTAHSLPDPQCETPQ